MYLDLDGVRAALGAALEAEGKEKPKAWEQDDQPRLCPAPTEDTPHGSSKRALDYEDDVHARVNPLAPIPRGFGVKVIDPETGEYVYFDDCFRYAGDLVDNDMRPGGLAEGKALERPTCTPKIGKRCKLMLIRLEDNLGQRMHAVFLLSGTMQNLKPPQLLVNSLIAKD